MPEYDRNRFAPPAPLAEVDITHPETGAVCSSVPLLIDSGADVTLLPQSVVTRLGVSLIPDRQYELVGFDGTPRLSPAVRLKLSFLRRTFEGLFLLIDEECGILGRNVLNALPIVLDGPRLKWSELPRA